MARVAIKDIKLLFECKEHKTQHECDPVDLVVCGTPMCEICNEEMSIEDYALVDIS